LYSAKPVRIIPEIYKIYKFVHHARLLVTLQKISSKLSKFNVPKEISVP